VPANADYVLRIDTTTGDVSRMPVPLLSERCRFKYLRGERAADGRVFCIPACASFVLVLDPATGVTARLPLPETCGEWQWHGAQLAADGCMYAVPANAGRVLKIDPSSDAITLVGPELEPGVRNKWYGGLRALSGDIWCMPYNASRLLRISPGADPHVQLVGPDWGAGGWKWHGGVRTGRHIIGIPSHAQRVLRIDTETGVTDLIGEPLVGEYKWGGACVDAAGVVWGVPSDTNMVIRIDPVRGETRLIGPVCELGDVLDSRSGEKRISTWVNKWQGAVLGDDGRIYCAQRATPEREHMYCAHAVAHHLRAVAGQASRATPTTSWSSTQRLSSWSCWVNCHQGARSGKAATALPTDAYGGFRKAASMSFASIRPADRYVMSSMRCRRCLCLACGK
jgi:hypothetical protein